MGYFTKTRAASAWGMVRPLTREAVTAVLDDWDASYGIDDDGDVGGSWDGHMFIFMVRGDQDQKVLAVRGRWARDVTPDRRDDVRALLDAWHHETLWPKTYTQLHDDTLAVYTELNVPCTGGVTLTQLNGYLRCALATSIQVFDHLAEHLPADDRGSGDA